MQTRSQQHDRTVETSVTNGLAGAPAPGDGSGHRDGSHGPRRWFGSAPPGILLVCGALGLLFAAPLVYLLQSTLTGDADLRSLWDLYRSERTISPLRNTLVLATATAASASVAGTCLAWLTTRTDLPLQRIWATLSPLPLVFPSFVGALALIAAVGPGGLLDTWVGTLGYQPSRPEGFWGAWLVLTLFTTPYVFLPAAARMLALPRSLEESARLLGRSPFSVFWTVVLPQVRGAIRAGALLVFLYTVSDFGVVVLLRYETLTRSIYTSRLVPDRSLPLSFLLGLVALTVVAVERVAAQGRPAVEGVRAERPLRYRLGRWRWPALGAVLGWVTLALGLPLASLGMWAWRGMTGRGSHMAARSGVTLGDLAAPAGNTVLIGLVTAAVAVAVLLPIAYLGARHRAPASDAIHGLVATGFALPGVVIALAVVSWALDLPQSLGLYQSLPLLVLAYLIHMGAQSLRPAQVAVEAVPRRLDEAARVLGAGRTRRFRTVDLPLMLPGLGAAGGLVLLSTMKELPITLLVAPTGFETLATRIWHDTESAFLAEAGFTSLLLVALSGGLTWLLVVRRR